MLKTFPLTRFKKKRVCVRSTTSMFNVATGQTTHLRWNPWFISQSEEQKFYAGLPSLSRILNFEPTCFDRNKHDAFTANESLLSLESDNRLIPLYDHTLEHLGQCKVGGCEMVLVFNHPTDHVLMYTVIADDSVLELKMIQKLLGRWNGWALYRRVL